jgi:hypothetical protein
MTDVMPLTQTGPNLLTPQQASLETIGPNLLTPQQSSLEQPGPNLLTAQQASLEDGTTTGWIANANCTISNSTAQAFVGTHSLALTATATGGMNAISTNIVAGQDGIPITGGLAYTATCSFRAASTAQTVQLQYIFIDATHTAISYPQGPSFAESTTAWTTISFTATAPANAAYIRLYVEIAATAAVGEVHYVDNVYLGLAGTTTGWYAANNCTIANSTAQALDGTHSLAITATAAGDCYPGTTPATGVGAVAVTPGENYTMTINWRAATTSRTCRVIIQWLDSGGNGLTPYPGTNVNDTTTGWTVNTVTAVAPAGAAYATVLAYIYAPAAGEVHYIDSVSFGLAGTTGWVALVNCSIFNSTAQAFAGTHSLALSATAVGDMWAGTPSGLSSAIPVVAGQIYMASIWTRAVTVSRTAFVFIQWTDASGSYISEVGTPFINTTTGWTQGSATGIAPSNAVYAIVLCYIVGASAAGEVHYFDQIFFAQVIPVVGAVSLTGETLCKFGDSGYVKLMLQGGPLDGEQQIVLDISRTPGYPIVFNVPNSQTFAPDGVTLIDLGLQVTYTVATQGPPPDVGSGDTWDTSWFLNFVPESYTPRPPPITPPLVPPDYAAPAVWMGVNSGMIVNADNPSAGVWMLDTQADLDVVGTSLSVDWATVGLVAATTLIAEGTVPPPEIVLLQATTGLTVGAVTYPNVVVMGATTTLAVVARSTALGAVNMSATTGMNVIPS